MEYTKKHKNLIAKLFKKAGMLVEANTVLACDKYKYEIASAMRDAARKADVPIGATPALLDAARRYENRDCLFGKIENGQMRLNDIGQKIDIRRHKIFNKYNDISADEYVIMPNHVHGIINIVGAIPCNRPVNNVKNKTTMHGNRNENRLLF